jgi:hypothetical protein
MNFVYFLSNCWCFNNYCLFVIKLHFKEQIIEILAGIVFNLFMNTISLFVKEKKRKSW